MVFFDAKDNSFSIDNPSQFLSDRAIERRTKQQISITEQDLPVNQEYINTLVSMGLKAPFASKWFNGVLIQTDSSKLSQVEALPFVTAIEFVAPGPLATSQSNGFKINAGTIQGRTQSTEIQNHLLGVDMMHLEGNTGSGMLIGVFDGGFLGVDQAQAFDHLFQQEKLAATFDFVGNSDNVFRYDDHGTKALSVIAADEAGVFTGIASGAEFILCVTEDVSGEYRVEEYNWLFAAEMADSAGVDIISTSLGYHLFDDPGMNYQLQDMDGATAAVSKAATIAASKGIVLAISAGNEGNSFWRTITAPADVQDAITVGAITEDTVKASFSSIGPTADGRIKPDVVALGVKTSVINRNGNVVFNNGTSFSAPQIAGLAAGVWVANPEFNYKEVIEVIREAGHTSASPNNQTGNGIPNYVAAKKLVLSVDEPVGDQAIFKLYPNPMGSRLYLLSEMPVEGLTLFIHNIQGQKYLEDRLYHLEANTEHTIELPGLPEGIYMITILTENSSGTYRLIRE